MKFFWSQLAAQAIALLTFFAFPIIQYLIVRRYSHNQGMPELWFLPAYGYRFVMRNMHGSRVLSDMRYKVFLREVIPKDEHNSVATYRDIVLHDRSDLFCLPGTDQILVSFRIEVAPEARYFVYTDKLGSELSKHRITGRQILIVDYMANVENLFNFDIKLAKRAELFYQTVATLDPTGQDEHSVRIDRVLDLADFKPEQRKD